MGLLDLVVDIGNTNLKYSFADGKVIGEKIIVSHEEALVHLRGVLKKNHISKSIISSTAGSLFSNEVANLVGECTQLHRLACSSKLPFKSNYTTSETLGLDRIANVSAVSVLFPESNCLIIDAGSCITYDLLSEDNVYLGGSITPGFLMRLKSMNDYSARLPFYSDLEKIQFPGRSTEQCLKSGVFYGILGEINQFISETKQSFGNSKVIITGGDGFYFVGGIKKPIFANPKLTLQGLYEILKVNI